MKKRFIIILIAALLLLCACQPTPEEPVVLQKDQDLMIQKGEATLPPEETYTPPEAPERWQYDYEEGALTVHVDAKVTVPDVLVKMIADAHGATITVDSEPGKGTTVSVTLA